MIIAFDFDGVLVTDEFPNIGTKRSQMVDLCKEAQRNGIETILHTCRVGQPLEEAIAFCEAEGLEFTAVNDNTRGNVAQYGSNSRKVYADYYIDDKHIGYTEWSVIVKLEEIINITKMLRR